ncbi:AimR family lysis-lysogeny pheromone receptor [Bacillus cereus]|uniref:AimR family lysis-lysogeny pheromone receptor n=1 Tax=Bacillus cereus TaxID=1396 RepID=UPI00301311A0
MNIVYERFNKVLESNNKSWGSIARVTETSSSSISEWGNRGKELSAIKIAKIAHEVFPNSVELMERSCIENFNSISKRVKSNMRGLFVVAYLNGNESILKFLIQKSMECDDCYIRKMSDVMKLFYARAKRIKNSKVIYGAVDELRKKITKSEVDLLILCDILKISILGDIGDFNIFEVYKNRAIENLINVEDQEVQSLYDYWITDIWSYYLHRKNDTVRFRSCNDLLWKYKDLRFFPIMQAMLHARIGEHTIFRNYEDVIHELDTALTLCIKRNCKYKQEIIVNNINFTKLYWKRDIKTIDFGTLHPAEKCMYYFEQGKVQEARNGIEELEKRGMLTPIQLTYKGVIYSDKKLILQAIDRFKSYNDFFFVQYANEMYNRLNI